MSCSFPDKDLGLLGIVEHLSVHHEAAVLSHDVHGPFVRHHLDLGAAADLDELLVLLSRLDGCLDGGVLGLKHLLLLGPSQLLIQELDHLSGQPLLLFLHQTLHSAAPSCGACGRPSGPG